MIQEGEVPPSIYLSLEEAESGFGEHCKTQIEAADRLPKTFDYAMIVELDLAADDAERFATIRTRRFIPTPAGRRWRPCLIVVVIALLFYAFAALRVLRQYERGVVFAGQIPRRARARLTVVFVPVQQMVRVSLRTVTI